MVISFAFLSPEVMFAYIINEVHFRYPWNPVYETSVIEQDFECGIAEFPSSTFPWEEKENLVAEYT